jgi:NADH-quinone oxidoreductase subunit E
MTERERNFPALLERLKSQCEAIIARYEHKRSALLPVVHLFQACEGYVSPQAMRAVAGMLDLTPAEVESTVSFYTLFYRKPVGKYMLQVCRGLACTLCGAEEIMAYLRQKLGVGHLETTGDGLFSYEEVECLAACDRASCMQVNLEFVYDVTPGKIDEMIAQMRAGTYSTPPMAQTEKPERTWIVKPDVEIARGRKSPGATGVSNPDNAGGVGDASGVIMLDRIVNREIELYGRTHERAVAEPGAIAELVEEEASSAGR